MKKEIFLPAIEEMQAKHEDLYGPESFQDYILKHNLPTANTAACISVDSYEKLNPLLRDKNVMVFRLGQSEVRKGTQFALRRVDNILDFFLVDHEVFTDDSGHEYPVEESKLLPYRILNNLTETSFVNLALNTGLLSTALEIQNISPTATSQSSFTFMIKLHNQDEMAFSHNKGQVEIDSLFLAERTGSQTLFVVEAKSDDFHKSLAKHKLVYPVMAIANNVPQNIDIVPLYLKVLRSEHYFHFHILECSLPDPRKFLISINELIPKKYIHLKIRF
jgi:hypothetical protein